MSYVSNLKKSLNKCIESIAANRGEYCLNPNKDFTRHRKVDFSSVVKAILCFGGKSLNKEILECFGFSPDTLTTSAFVQQRSKIKPEAFYLLFKRFISNNHKDKLFHGYRLLAVDGSNIYTPRNENDVDSLRQNQYTFYNQYHLNAFYDLLTNTYYDAVVQKCHSANEHKAYIDMVDRYDSSTPAIYIADRCYESFNNMAHVQEKGHKFLTRLKDIDSTGMLKSFDFPDGEFDISMELKLTRKQTNELKQMAESNPCIRFLPSKSNFDYLPLRSRKADPLVFYAIPLRFVRIQITDDSFEVLATNLDEKQFPPSVLKELYSMRWGIETSFRNLKYTVGLSAFHSKKSEHIVQEIFARLTLYSFSELVTSHIAIRKKKRKHIYKINFSVAVYACRNFLLGRYAPKAVEAVISNHILPYRPNLSKPRSLRNIPPASFSYRVA